MSCGNPYKHKIKMQSILFFDTFAARNSNTRRLTDDQMECMQFGICYFIPKKLEEIPYFHY